VAARNVSGLGPLA